MFCPNCGSREEQALQFCRACGTELGSVRGGLMQTDVATKSIAAAREEIAHALAARIQTGDWGQLGAMIPEMEKLLESPQERRLRLLREDETARLRRSRAGVITAAAGLGEILLSLLLSVGKSDLLVLAGFGVVAFLVGLGMVINARMFTMRRQSLDAFESEKPAYGILPSGSPTTQINPAARPSLPRSSVTEHTTRHLSNQ